MADNVASPLHVENFPEDLRRRAKAEAALRGITLRDLTIEAVHEWCCKYGGGKSASGGSGGAGGGGGGGNAIIVSGTGYPSTSGGSGSTSGGGGSGR